MLSDDSVNREAPEDNQSLRRSDKHPSYHDNVTLGNLQLYFRVVAPAKLLCVSVFLCLSVFVLCLCVCMCVCRCMCWCVVHLCVCVFVLD